MYMIDTKKFVKLGFDENRREWENESSSVQLRGGEKEFAKHNPVYF